MSLIDRPWARIRTPAAVPGDLDADAVWGLDDLGFAQLVQSQLVPQEQDVAGRQRWEQLWEVLRADNDLADRTYNVLEEFIDDTEDALDGGELDPAADKRARKFLLHCDSAWQRIDRGRDRGRQPLAWAGRAGAFEPKARMVIATLVAAVARHRTAVSGSGSDHDRQLWGALAEVNLDPRDYPNQQESP